MTIIAQPSRKTARDYVKVNGGEIKDLQPPREILGLNGLTGKKAPVKPGVRWVVVK